MGNFSVIVLVMRKVDSGSKSGSRITQCICCELLFHHSTVHPADARILRRNQLPQDDEGGLGVGSVGWHCHHITEWYFRLAQKIVK